MNYMSKTLLLLACCLGAGSVLTGCGDGKARNVAGDISRITGTWHYEMNTSIRILELTDSTMLIDYTCTKNDTTFYLQSQSRRSLLPESLRMEQTPTITE